MLAQGYGGILWLIIAVIDIYVVIRIVQGRADPIWKAIWIVAVVVMPFIGPLLWWLFADKD